MFTSINEVSTLAHHARKATKPELLKLAEKVALGEKLSFSQAAVLYAAFLPAKPRATKDFTQWVAQAIAPKSEKRGCLTAMCVKDGVLVATDSHRLHMVDMGGMKDGYYNKMGDRLASLGPYVDYARVIPKRPYSSFLSELDFNDRAVSKDGITQLVVVKLNGALLVKLNLKYYLQARDGFTKDAIFSYGDLDQSISIKEGNKTAVIMPVFTREGV